MEATSRTAFCLLPLILPECGTFEANHDLFHHHGKAIFHGRRELFLLANLKKNYINEQAYEAEPKINHEGKP